MTSLPENCSGQPANPCFPLAILIVITIMGLTNGPMLLLGDSGARTDRAGICRTWPDLECTGTVLRFFHVLLHAFHYPDDIDFRGIFPTDQLPGWLALIGSPLPLAQGVALIRPLLAGEIPPGALVHIAILLATTVIAFSIALHLTRRRLLK